MLALIIVFGVTLFAGSAHATHSAPEEGKRYWLVESHVAQQAGSFIHYFNFIHELGDKRFSTYEIRTFVITGKDTNYYTLHFDDGSERSVRLKTVDQAFAKHIIVNYDPVQKAKQQAAAASKQRIETIKAKKWPSAIEKLVLDRKIQIGMTPEQAQLAWGNPDHINRSVGSWGVREQWVYGSTYLYFDNEKLTSFQDSR